jgi:DMSO reductase family type II enzyme heme b subunit
MPIRPANLTQGWTFRGGRDARSILLRLLAGIDGAGMPSYAEAVSTEDAWQLAYYVASLQEAAHWNMIVRAQPAHGALPETPEDPRWHTATSTTVRTRNVVTPQGEWANPPTIRAVTVQVMVADDAVAFRLTWDDPTQEPPAQPAEDAEAPPQGPDGLALVFKPSGGEGDVVTLQLWPYTGSPALDVCAWTAGAASAVEAIVEHFDAVRAPAEGQLPRRSAARYHDGRWELVVHRPVRPPQPDGAAVLAPGQFTAVAFAVWDGANPDARAVSPWVDVTLPVSPAKKKH